MSRGLGDVYKRQEKEGMVHFAGFALLMVLMAVVMYNDIMKLF